MIDTTLVPFAYGFLAFAGIAVALAVVALAVVAPRRSAARPSRRTAPAPVAGAAPREEPSGPRRMISPLWVVSPGGRGAPFSAQDLPMPASPVRLAIASPDQAVADGLRRMLAEQVHRVVVVDDAGRVDVVLHHGRRAGRGPSRRCCCEPGRRRGCRCVSGWSRSCRWWRPRRATPVPDVETHGLSAREAEVLTLIAEGLTNQEIADRVFISINSVKTYVRSAYRKIGVNSRSQAAVWVLQNGLVRRRG